MDVVLKCAILTESFLVVLFGIQHLPWVWLHRMQNLRGGTESGDGAYQQSIL